MNVLYRRLMELKERIETLPIPCSPSGKARPRMGAVILDKHSYPISYGYNSYHKTHPLMKMLGGYGVYMLFPHAEIAACIASGDKPGYKDRNNNEDQISQTTHKNQIMIVARVNNQGQLRYAKPCIHCQSALKNKFKAIYYTNNKGELVLLKEK